MTELQDSLRAAMRSKSLITVNRTIARVDGLTGFVVGISAKWTVLHLAEDTWLNGYAAIKTTEVESIEDNGPDDLTFRALDLYGDRPRRPIGLSFGNTGELLSSANKKFPLVTIYTEADFADECYIGVVKETNSRSLKLLEINPRAEWDDRPTLWSLKKITRVDFGGRYEKALIDLGGRPPKG